MKRIEFDCVCELAELMDKYIEDNAIGDEYPIVAAYGKYEVVKALSEALIMFGNPIGEIFELENYDMSHYDKEYVVYLTVDGVTCEKNYHDGIYYIGGGDISFVHEDCSSKLLEKIESDVIYEFGFSDVDDECDGECECECGGYCDECCDCCEFAKENEITIEKDGDMHGFSVNRSNENGWSSYSFYSTDRNLAEEMARLFR